MAIMTQANSNKRHINGVLLLNKASGTSSNRALQQVRHLYCAQKAGHTGILDPLAEGLLPICFGEATKFCQYLLDADKAYIARLKLGEATSTGDAEGDIIEIIDKKITKEDFQAACNQFIGEIKQTPPMYSALKHEGKPLYEYARKGIVIERKSRVVHIFSINLLAFTQNQAEIAVCCTKGTYIRTLAEEIAKSAGTVAHLTGLQRTKSGQFLLNESITFKELENMDEEKRMDILLPCDILLTHLPSLTLDDKHILRLQQGQTVQFSENCATISPLRVYSAKKQFIGLVQYASGCLKALRLMNTGNNLS